MQPTSSCASACASRASRTSPSAPALAAQSHRPHRRRARLSRSHHLLRWISRSDGSVSTRPSLSRRWKTHTRWRLGPKPTARRPMSRSAPRPKPNEAPRPVAPQPVRLPGPGIPPSPAHTYEPWGACDLAELAAREVDEHLKSEELAERNRAYRSTVVRPESTWETRPVGDGWMEMVGPENEGGLTVRFKPWPAS